MGVRRAADLPISKRGAGGFLAFFAGLHSDFYEVTFQRVGYYKPGRALRVSVFQVLSLSCLKQQQQHSQKHVCNQDTVTLRALARKLSTAD